MPAERLALGTVQFGLDYGVANRTGRVEAGEVARILEVAHAAGIDTLDTAAGYGDAEAVLGETGVSGWRIVTKLPEVPAEAEDVAAWVRSETEASIERLGVDRLHGLLLHRPQQLTGTRGAEIREALEAVKAAGLTARVGVSVYGPDDLDQVWEAGLDLVQSPYNALDRRLSSSVWLERLSEAGVEVHTRSAFLQGVLLMTDRPAWFDPWNEVLARWDAWVEEQGVSRVAAALAVPLADTRIARVVVGVDSPDQLEEILVAVTGPLPAPPDTLASDDLDLIDPSRWRLS